MRIIYTTIQKNTLEPYFNYENSKQTLAAAIIERGDCLLKSRKVYFAPYPRFTRSGKTRICLLKRRKVYFTPCPRFTRLGKTRILCLKHILEKNRSSVRPSVRLSVRPSVSAFYPNPASKQSILTMSGTEKKQNIYIY
jgi:hypothetical protein